MTGVHTLDRMADHARLVQGVWTDDVHSGDWVVVRTRNSTYAMAALDDRRFLVAGGWFASHGAESAPVGVLGCTWGGRAILTSVLAAPGMFIEFDNGVHTTRILEVRLIRHANTATIRAC